MTSTETRRAKPAQASELAPIEWYRSPGLTEPTPITITADGRVFGHVATWSSSHVGMPGQNVKPPRSRTDYSYYHVGSAMVSDAGEPTEISVGRLVQGTGHAPLTSDAAGASDWYDSTGSIVATVCAGEDDHGIWFSGSLAPDLDEVSLYRLRASAISGDWRVINNSLELTAALCVPSPGFPIPRARVASASDLVPIVAAGMVAPRLDTQQEAPMPDSDTPESLTAASPFSKGEPAPPSGDDDEAYESGDSVLLDDLDVVAQVVGDDGEGGVTIEVTVPASMLSRADEDTAMAASARFTERMADRARDAKLDKLTAVVASLAESSQAERDARAAAESKLDQLLTKDRNRDFDAITAGLDA